jgi:Bacteriophage baseplate protein W
MTRADIAFPFRIAAGSGQAAQATYQDHVDQLIRQVLLTDPGERVNLPVFGAGMRRLLFAPMSSSLAATTKLIVTQALKQWIPTQIVVQDVTVVTSDQDAGIPEGAIVVTITYQLVETRSARQTVVTVLP